MKMEDLNRLTTEAVNPATLELDHLNTQNMVHVMNAENLVVVQSIQEILPQIALAIDAITLRMKQGGRLIYMGAGTSGRLGVLDASECPPTFSIPAGMVIGLIAGGDTALRTSVEEAEDKPEQGANDLQAIELKSTDSVVGLTASGRTPYVLGGLHYARSLGALTIGIACNHPADLSQEADISILPLVGAEVLSGSTRLKAGTAQKLILNMLSTGVMVRLGKTYGNLMVDVKPTNTKLRLRARRLIIQICRVSDEEAQHLLESCGWEVKTAIIVARLKVSAGEARRLLASAGGFVRHVLEESHHA